MDQTGDFAGRSRQPLTALEISMYYRARVPGLLQEGEQWRSRCPLHGGNNRDSFSVSAATGAWNCFSGCNKGGHLVGLEAELFHSGDRKAAWRAICELIGRTKRIVAEYDYTDETGKLLFQVLRYEPKDFRQRRPNPEYTESGKESRWIFSTKDVPKVVYRLPQVLAANIVYVCEGEKDVHALEAFGLTATCNPGGASKSLMKTKWLPAYNTFFKAKNVIVLPDLDEPGQMHGGTVARNLAALALSLRVVNVPSPHKDISAWIESGATAQDLAALVESTGLYVPPNEMTVASTELIPTVRGGWESFARLTQRKSDLANAEVFADRHNDVVRWVPEVGNWVIWSEEEGRWAIDHSLTIHQLAVAHLGRMRQAAMDLPDPDLMKHAVWSESKGHVDAMLSGARSFVVTHTDKLDADPYLLNVMNGTINLKTGELQPHEKTDFITKLVPVVYDPDARSAEFEDFLSTIMCGNQDLVTFLQLFTGYSLCGWTGERKLVCCHGQSGANGKSTFCDVLQMIGGEYYTAADFSSFQEASFKRDGSQATPDLARLCGARIVTAAEPKKGTKLDVGLIKNATGEDKLTVRHLHKASFNFVPAFKLWLIFNDAPRIEGSDDAMWNRVLRVPFDHKFTKPDLHIKERLTDPVITGPAALAWAVRGSVEYHQSGLKLPQVIREGTQQYRDDQDPLIDFYQEHCVFRENASWETDPLHATYRQWGLDEHLQEWQILKRRKLVEHLKKFRKCSAFEIRKDVWALRGIGPGTALKEPGDLVPRTSDSGSLAF